MRSFAEILDRFSTGQRVFVLILLLVFSSATYLGGHYMKAESCSEVVSDNRQLLEDYMAISKMLKAQNKYKEDVSEMTTLKSLEVGRSPAGEMRVVTEDTIMTVESISKDSISNMILQIAERNIKKYKKD